MSLKKVKQAAQALGSAIVDAGAEVVDTAKSKVADEVSSFVDKNKTKDPKGKGNRMKVDLTKVNPTESAITVNLTKGENVKLDAALTQVVFGLEWDPMEGTGDFDADASIVQLDKDGKAIDFIYFRKLESTDGAILHTGDNLTGADTDEADPRNRRAAWAIPDRTLQARLCGSGSHQEEHRRPLRPGTNVQHATFEQQPTRHRPVH